MSSFFFGPYRLAYESFGSGPRNIVLLHGILMSSGMNRGVAETLAGAGYRVHLLDLLNHGASDKPDELDSLRMDQYAEQVVALLDHLGLEKAVIGGVSLGALVALQVAVRHPRRVEAMVLEMPVLENAVPGIVVLLAPLLFSARFFAIPMAAGLRLLRTLPHSDHPAVLALASFFGNEPSGIAAILSGALIGPIAPTGAQRRAIEAPTLIIGHRFDALHPFNDAEALSVMMPNARFAAAESVIELRLRPERLLRIFRDFLDDLPSPRKERVATVN